jgi:hypothetical protein
MNENELKPAYIVAVKILHEYKIELTFDDGFKKAVDLKPLLNKPITEPLKDPEYFAQVRIDSIGGIFWPNSYDICPDFLRYYI